MGHAGPTPNNHLKFSTFLLINICFNFINIYIMKIYVDIDGTICTDNGARPKTTKDYLEAKPLIDRIDTINKLYDEGHEIYYWTARGATSGVDWTEITTQQLSEWGCRYHQLIMNHKPHFDLYICDKSWNADEWFTQSLYEQIPPVELS